MSLKNKKGFTLIEVLLSITISVLLFFILTETYSASQKIYFRTDTKAEMTQNGRVMLDRMVRELRQTPEVITPLPQTIAEGPVNEIIFQDGHSMDKIRYIRYYVSENRLERQEIYFYFQEPPDVNPPYVYFYAIDQYGQPPTMVTSTERIIGEYVDDIEFWGSPLTNINLYLSKNKQTQIINTSVYGRNL